MNKPDRTLRNELLDVCRDGHSVDDVARALVDALMIVLIASAPDVDACERAVVAAGEDMRRNVRRAHEEFHAMREGLRERQQ